MGNSRTPAQEAPSLKDKIKSPLWWAPIVLVILFFIGLVAWKQYRISISRGMEFRGRVVYTTGGELKETTSEMGRSRGFGRRRSGAGAAIFSAIYFAIFNDPVSAKVIVVTDNDQRIEWPVNEQVAGFFGEDDYIIKEAGEKPAVFRMGEQVKGTNFFRSDDVEYHSVAKRKVAEVDTVAEEESKEADLRKKLAQDIEMPVTQESIDALLAKAKKLWQSGQQAEAVECSKQALGLERRLYAKSDSRIAELEAQIKAAEGMLAGQ